MTEIMLARPVLDPEKEIERLARRYASAGGLGIQVLNTLGTQADGLLDRLPAPVRAQLDGATRAALTQAMRDPMAVADNRLSQGVTPARLSASALTGGLWL